MVERLLLTLSVIDRQQRPPSLLAHAVSRPRGRHLRQSRRARLRIGRAGAPHGDQYLVLAGVSR